jgi:hypothetical protein
VTPAALLGVLALAHAHPTGAETGLAETSPAAALLPPNITVTAVHGLALMAVMRTTEAVIWPDPFARTHTFAAHYEEAAGGLRGRMRGAMGVVRALVDPLGELERAAGTEC